MSGPTPVSFTSFLRTPWNQRYLLSELIKRDISGRYRGSIGGIFWAIVNPVLMLVVYTFFFSVVFKARWSTGGAESKGEFALILFSGLLVFNFVAECLSRSAALILSNANYVKKVIFPLEILPWVVIGGALFHALIGFTVWCVFFLLVNGHLYLTTLLLPIALLPVALFSAGLIYIVSSLGVYLRDIGQFVTIITAVLPFTSPIFFPVKALPEEYRVLMYLNPLTQAIEQVRQILVYGALPAMSGFLIFTIISIAFAYLGYTWFQKVRNGFADVL